MKTLPKSWEKRYAEYDKTLEDFNAFVLSGIQIPVSEGWKPKYFQTDNPSHSEYFDAQVAAGIDRETLTKNFAAKFHLNINSAKVYVSQLNVKKGKPFPFRKRKNPA